MTPSTTPSPDLGHRGKNARDVLRAGETVIAVLDHGQHDVVGRQAMCQRERVLPGYIRILRALQDADGTAEIDGAAEHEVVSFRVIG
jgi:hypothetical protein